MKPGEVQPARGGVGGVWSFVCPALWRDAYRQMLTDAVDQSAYWELNADRSILAQSRRKQAALSGVAAAATNQPEAHERPDTTPVGVAL